jgi:hypothetical protein
MICAAVVGKHLKSSAHPKHEQKLNELWRNDIGARL